MISTRRFGQRASTPLTASGSTSVAMLATAPTRIVPFARPRIASISSRA
jgi:hypothetical protein